MSHFISSREMLAVEFRVLPLRRFVRDRLYWGWVTFWLAMPFDAFTWVLLNTPLLNGCIGHFEWRDSMEYPAIGRWSHMRWLQERKRRVADEEARRRS